jgi:hypothetical protein
MTTNEGPNTLEGLLRDSGLLHLLADIAETSGRAVGSWASFVDLRAKSPELAMTHLVDLHISLEMVIQPDVLSALTEVKAIRAAIDDAGDSESGTSADQ